MYLEKKFISHILRYVGVGLISGSIVHAGTLGGESLHYILLVVMGIIGFTIGTVMENKEKFDRHLFSFILISTVVSIGTGMVSGGTQHYLDNPLFASYILPAGFLIAYFAFAFRDFRQSLSFKRIAIACMLAGMLFFSLYSIAHVLPALEDHHQD